jgi:FSR family fosmidomycin resistance protein-like MFS transporter
MSESLESAASARSSERGAAGPDRASAVAPQAADQSAQQVASRSQIRTAGVLVSAHAVHDSYSYVLQALLPAIIPVLGLTVGLAGSLVAVYQITSSLLQPVIGYLADRSRIRWPAWGGVIFSGMAAGFLGLAPNYAVLVALLTLGGIGSAIFHPVAAAMTGAAAPPHRRGRWMGLFVTAGAFGLGLGPLMVGPLLAHYGPSGTWPIILPALCIAVLVFALAPARPAITQRALP